MRCLIAALSAATVALLAANTARAGYENGDYYFKLDNYDNGGSPSMASGPSWTLPTGPTTTTDGALWVKSGSTYVLNAVDVNIECDFRTASDQPTVVITDTCLTSTGVAYGDVSIMGLSECTYPGYFGGDDGADGWGNTHPDPSRYSMHLGQYWVPSMGPTTDFQFHLKFWLGNESSYTAAVAAGDKVGDTGWFMAGPMEVGVFPFPDIDGTFKYMPSVVLRPQLAGDANRDGKVDINDLSKVLTNYDKTGMLWADGDFNNDGTVDINDLSIVLTNYDKSVGSSAAGIAAVPEPSAMVLTTVGMLGLLACVRRRRRR